MNYRKFGKLDWEGSALAFGAMRLPTTDGNTANIDRPEAIRMIRYAIDHGVNYLDTAYLYHAGESELVVGEALKDGYREKIRLATKMPMRSVEKPEDLDRILNHQLEKLQTSKIDFYLFHGMNAANLGKVKEFKALKWAEDKMAEGKIDKLCFSFHDEYDVFKEIVDEYDNWTHCQIQYNFMDYEYQAGRRGVEYAAAHGMGVVVMEPLRGGLLGKEPPAAVAAIWEAAPQKRSPVEWALNWVWDQPEVSLLLSGMSTMEQVEQNCEYAGRSAIGSFSAEEKAVVDAARSAFRGRTPVPCTSCGYCMPCPNGVEIPRVFQIYNDAVMYDDPKMGRFRYRGPIGLQPEQMADMCIECGECLEPCPQSIDIPTFMREVDTLLGKKTGD
ncbi:MAG: aldo/keto reductase [Dehalococcoidales bacterium]